MARNVMTRAKAALTGKMSTEDLITGLETTKLTLERRAAELEAAKVAAQDRRREALISGEDAADAAQAARAAEDDANAVADALVEVERRLIEASARREAENEQARMNSIAAALEADAVEFERAGAELHAAVGALRTAHLQFAMVVSGRASANCDPDNPYRASPSALATILLKAGLAEAFPDLGLREHYGPIEGAAISPRVAGYVSNLRDLAAAVRSGEASAEIPEQPNDEPSFEARNPEKTVWVTTPFHYMTDRGERPISTGGQSLHVALADAALSAGFAEPKKPDSWDAHKRHDVRGPLLSEYGRLDFNLSDAKRADIAEQRAAWQADQAALRAEILKEAA